MNYALILAAGVGQRMRNGGLPKQFLKLNGKPIIIYTLEKFDQMDEISKIVISCHGDYLDYMQDLLQFYQIKKVASIVVGGADRQASLLRGLDEVKGLSRDPENDIVVIHDGVRPLVSRMTIAENIRIAIQCGCAVTVHPVTESVVVTASDEIEMDAFKKRADTYTLTSPQTFRINAVIKAFQSSCMHSEEKGIPLLDAAMVYASEGGSVHMVKEQNMNLKVTTPEDFYILRSMLELEENKFIFGL